MYLKEAYRIRHDSASSSIHEDGYSAPTINHQVDYFSDGWTKHGSAKMVPLLMASEGLRERVPSGRDRNNLILEVCDFGAVVVEKVYMWGRDLSGTMQGAGGVGGLLSLKSSSTALPAAVRYYYTCDANGNVGQMINGSGNVVSHYEYSPFGQVLVATGAGAADNRFRFSTKYEDRESSLSYYGFRYYDAELGRWLNRDPIKEDGGVNLYGFVRNRSLNYWDYLGLTTKCCGQTPLKHGEGCCDDSIIFKISKEKCCGDQVITKTNGRGNRLKCNCAKNGGKWKIFWECNFSSLTECLLNNSPTGAAGRAGGFGATVAGRFASSGSIARGAGNTGVLLGTMDYLVGMAQCGSGICCKK